MNHFPGHQQALIKNNICIVVLSFPEHDNELINETFSKFDYDLAIDLCELQRDAVVGAAWDGQDFNIKMFDSWILGEDLKWHAPITKPDGNFYWNETDQLWIEILNQNPAEYEG